MVKIVILGVGNWGLVNWGFVKLGNRGLYRTIEVNRI